MNKVLVTDCWTRKALSLVRALGKEGIEVHSISHTLISPAIYSAHSHRHYIFPLAKYNKAEFIENLLYLIKLFNFDCIIPLEESTIDILYQNQKEIENYTKLALPSKDSYNIANDKWEAIKIVKSLNIPVPDSYLANKDVDINILSKKHSFPLIIKPRKSSGSRGLRKVENAEDFIKHFSSIKEKYGIPIIQDCLPQKGQGLGVACLVENGNTKVSFSYKRLREYPVSGGPGTLNESTDDITIKAYAENLMKELKWTGVAMIEFKIDERDNSPKFMEINPRFWGSLQLSILSGINFPYLLYLQTMGKDIPEQNYTIGIKSRWLIPGDIMHFIKNPERFNLTPSFFKFWDTNTFYSQFDKNDIKGNIAVIICNVLNLFIIKRWKEGVVRK